RLMIYLTASCNLKCIYCHCNSGGASGYMGDDDALKIVKKYIDFVLENNSDKKVIEITFMGGGEPLLRIKSIKRIVTFITEMKFEGSYALVTNGTVASDSDWDWLIKNKFKITISADGPPEIQDNQRPFFKKQIKTSVFLENRLRKLENLGAMISIRSTVMDTSKKSIDSICTYFNQFTVVKTHHLEPLSPAGRGFQFGLSDNIFYRDFFVNYATYLYSQPRRYQSSWFKPLDRSNGFCGAVYGNIIVTHDGYISLCAEVDSSMKDTKLGKKYIIAHISDDNPFQSEKAKKFSCENNTKNLTLCKKCVIQHKCGGGCYIKRDRDYLGDCDKFFKHYCTYVIPLNMSYLIGLYERNA
ncbi:MAG: radical SAM protein, partial [Candidatus Pacebacteria bacterium]|nr:radical SAM protein [Candidatus Paceibacterota bacterium]